MDSAPSSSRRTAAGRSAAARACADCLQQLAASAPTSAAAIAFGATLVAAWLRDQVAVSWLALWCGGMIVLGFARLGYRVWFAHRFDGSVERWEWRYAALTGATGLGWSLLAWLPESGAEAPHLGAITVLLCGAMVVGGSQLVASRIALFAFAAGAVLPMALRLAALDTATAAPLLLGLLGTVALVLATTRTQRRTLVGALQSRHEVGDLLRQQQVIFESAGEGIVFLRPGPEYVVSCNRRFAEMFGYPLAAMPGMPPWRWHPQREQWKRLVHDSLGALIAGQPYHAVMQLMRSDGSLFWGEITGMAVAGSELSAGTVWVISDITDQRHAEAALRASESRFRELVRLSSDLYWEQDADFRFTHFDGAEALQQRLPMGLMIGRSRWEALDMSPDSGQWADHVARLKRHEPFRDFVYALEANDGSRLWLSISGNPMFDDAGRLVGYHGTTSDITLRVESEERYRHLAYHDTLTRLPNRRLLIDRLEQALRSAQRNGDRVALLLLDLDGFKQVNDRHGHAAGDRVLEAVACRLKKTVRDADTVARMGGDEFVVLLPGVNDTEDAIRIAQKIHDSVCEPIADGRHLHCISTSIGISIFPEHGDSPDSLLQCADHAMYHGKSSGGRSTRLYQPPLLN